MSLFHFPQVLFNPIKISSFAYLYALLLTLFLPLILQPKRANHENEFNTKKKKQKIESYGYRWRISKCNLSKYGIEIEIEIEYMIDVLSPQNSLNKSIFIFDFVCMRIETKLQAFKQFSIAIQHNVIQLTYACHIAMHDNIYLFYRQKYFIKSIHSICVFEYVISVAWHIVNDVHGLHLLHVAKKKKLHEK